MKIAFAAPKLPRAGTLALLAEQGGELPALGDQIDSLTGGALRRAARLSGFEGKSGSVVELLAPAGTDLDRVLLVGIGKAEEIDGLAAQNIGGALAARLLGLKADEAVVSVGPAAGLTLPQTVFAANVGYGALLRSYRFDKYHTKKKPEDKPKLAKLVIQVTGDAAAKKAFAQLEPVAKGVFFTRDLVTEPANVIYPETLAHEAKALEELGVKVEVLGQAQMAKLGMGALLGVAQGSAREPKLLVLQWNGGKSKEAPLAFVGKGVTFDTGGISIKPAGGMEEMKWDMGGAGAVIGLLKALAGRKAKANVIGIAGLVENMPSGTAQRPGDVVTTMSGQTVEVLNTDAEGRLVLADAMWYAQNRFKPKFIVDLATLTGAIIVSLGHEYAGLFSNDDELANRLLSAGTASGEKLWRMPLGDAYDKMINSDIADMQNIGADRAAGSVTAAQFLQRFTNGVPWAHLDIAGVAWGKKDTPTNPRGGTGYGVRLLDRLVADYYEAK